MKPLVILRCPKGVAGEYLKIDLRTGEVEGHDTEYIIKLINSGEPVENASISNGSIVIHKDLDVESSFMHLLVANGTYGVYLSGTGRLSIFKRKSVNNWGADGNITIPLFPIDTENKEALARISKMRMLGVEENIIPLNSKDCICIVDDTNFEPQRVYERANILYVDSHYVHGESINIPNVEYIWNCALAEGDKFKLYAPKLKYISKMGMYNSKITDIYAPSLETIGNNAFAGSALRRIEIPDNCAVGDEAFASCRDLEEVTFLGSVRVLKNRTFTNCYKLKTIEIPYGCKTIGNECFSNCKRLTSAIIPNTVTTFAGANVFIGCDRLNELVLPTSIKAIYDNKFNRLIGIKRICIPKHLYKNINIPENCEIKLY